MKPEASVLQELEQLSLRIHQLCMENNMPVVIGYSYDDKHKTGRFITAYLDEEKGAFDSTVAGAIQILRLDQLSHHAIAGLEKVADLCDTGRAMSAAASENTLH